MARSQITVTEIVRAGIAHPNGRISDATNDHYFVGNDGQIFLEIRSTDGSSRTVSIPPASTLSADGLNIDPYDITVPAGGTVLAGPFRKATFNQSTDGSVYVNPEVSDTLEFFAFKLVRTA